MKALSLSTEPAALKVLGGDGVPAYPGPVSKGMGIRARAAFGPPLPRTRECLYIVHDKIYRRSDGRR